MNNFLRQQISNSQQSNGFLASMQKFDGILQWLTSFVQLTEEEQKDAGIYFGD